MSDNTAANIAYIAARRVKEERLRTKHIVDIEEIFGRVGYTGRVDKVDRAYRKLFRRTLQNFRLEWFPKKHAARWRGSRLIAIKLAKEGLLKGIEIDNEIYVDAPRSYMNIHQSAREYGMPYWFLLQLVENGEVRTKVRGDIFNGSYINIYDGQRAKTQFDEAQWTTPLKGEEKYDIVRERIYQILKGAPNNIRVIRKGALIYFSGKDFEEEMKKPLHKNEALLSRTRARLILGISDDELESYINSGKLATVVRNSKSMIMASSVRRLQATLPIAA